jgi:hypothetical protein
VATKLSTAVTNIYGSSVWNFFHVTLLMALISKQLLDFWKIRAVLLQGTENVGWREVR